MIFFSFFYHKKYVCTTLPLFIIFTIKNNFFPIFFTIKNKKFFSFKVTSYPYFPPSVPVPTLPLPPPSSSSFFHKSDLILPPPYTSLLWMNYLKVRSPSESQEGNLHRLCFLLVFKERDIFIWIHILFRKAWEDWMGEGEKAIFVEM